MQHKEETWYLGHVESEERRRKEGDGGWDGLSRREVGWQLALPGDGDCTQAPGVEQGQSSAVARPNQCLPQSAQCGLD